MKRTFAAIAVALCAGLPALAQVQLDHGTAQKLSELGIDPSQLDPSQVDPSQADPSSTTPGP